MKKALALVLLFAGCSVEPQQVTVPGTIVTRDIYERKIDQNDIEKSLYGKWYSDDDVMGFYYDAKDGKILGETVWCRDYNTTSFKEYSFEVRENFFDDKVDGGGHLLIHYIRNHNGTKWHDQVLTSYSMIRFQANGDMEEHFLMFPDGAVFATEGTINDITPIFEILNGAVDANGNPILKEDLNLSDTAVIWTKNPK